MKPIPLILSILILFTLGACTLQMPTVEAPTAFVLPTQSPPTDTLVPAALPALTDTAPPPTAEPPAAAQPTAASLPATEAPQPTAELPAASQQPVSQPTATLPAPAAAASPAAAFDPYTAFGKPKYQNPMEFPNLAEWAQAETDRLPDNRNIRLQFKDGKLYVTGKRPGFSTWWFSYHTLSDAYIEMTFDSEDCSGQDAYGLIFRGPPHLAGVSYGYVVSFTCSGKLWVFRLDDATPWEAETLIDETAISAINSGSDEQNVIGVRTEGERFIIYANGAQVAELEDDEFEKGRVGVFVRAASPNAYTYRVTNFVYWLLEEDK